MKTEVPHSNFKWRTIPLSVLVEAINGWNPARSPSNEVFDYIDLGAVDQDAKIINAVRKVLCGEAPSRARQLVAQGDVLVSTVRPNLNGVALVPEELHGATASTGFCVLRPREGELDGEYLFQWVKSPWFVAEMVNKATGASYPAVSDRIIFDSRIPLPPLPTQRMIADVLNRTEAMCDKRRTTLFEIEALTQSMFVDLFGNPSTNPKAWLRKRLVDLGKVITGSTPSSTITGMFGGPIPFVTPGDLESDEPVKRGLTLAGAAESRTVRAGATLICCIGATIGKMGITSVLSAFNQQINAVEWSDEVDDLYGYAVLRFFKPTIKTWGASTTLPILKKSSFEKIEIPVPPLALQREFAKRVRAVNRLREKQMASLAELKKLFASLQQCAFKGELQV